MALCFLSSSAQECYFGDDGELIARGIPEYFHAWKCPRCPRLPSGEDCLDRLLGEETQGVEGRFPLLPDLGHAAEGTDPHPNKQAVIYTTATSQLCLEALSCRTASPQLSAGQTVSQPSWSGISCLSCQGISVSVPSR